MLSGDFQDVPLDDTPPKPADKPLPLKKGGAVALSALREENADLKRRLAAVEAVRPFSSHSWSLCRTCTTALPSLLLAAVVHLEGSHRQADAFHEDGRGQRQLFHSISLG
jgi:hypothetical protein